MSILLSFGRAFGYNIRSPTRTRPKGRRMLSIQGKPGRLCDTLSRRELLTVGSVGLLGLCLLDVLRHEASAQSQARHGAGFGRAQSLIFLYLQGSPSHIDTWD